MASSRIVCVVTRTPSLGVAPLLHRRFHRQFGFFAVFLDRRRA
jgi:hypothetical protein